MAKKIKKHSFILEMGVYLLFFFLFSILFNLFGYNENTFESNLSPDFVIASPKNLRQRV